MQTPEQRREYYRIYMAEYREGKRRTIQPVVSQPVVVVVAEPKGGCWECGEPIPRERFYYCSKKCMSRAANRRLRAKNRERYAEYSRKFRLERPADSTQACRNWRANNPAYYKESCPECGRPKNKEAQRCDACRLQLERTCKNNPACGIKYSHKHCQTCGEPMRRRWDALCGLCEQERQRLGLTVTQFRLAARRADASDEEDLAA